jgi:hypothetical protein
VFSEVNWKLVHKDELGSSVGIVSGYELEERALEVRFPAEDKDTSSSLCVQL